MSKACRVEQIRRDNVSGAQQLSEKIARLIAERFGRKKLTVKQSTTILTDMARAMIQAQPAMASVINLFNYAFNRLDRIGDAAAAGPSVCAAAQSFARAMAQHTDEISAQLFALMRNKNVVLTHSASQAVRAGLLFCWRRGRRFSVICTESRPLLEGANFARAFAAKGIPTCLVSDAQAFAFVKGETEFRGKLNLVLVGADSVSRQGVTNKAGTLGLAVAARTCRVPFYVLAASEKFLPAGYPIHRAIRSRPAAEILATPARGLTVINRYFDVTPLPYVTAVLTEQGPLSRRQLAVRLRPLTLHPVVAKIVKEVV